MSAAVDAIDIQLSGVSHREFAHEARIDALVRKGSLTAAEIAEVSDLRGRLAACREERRDLMRALAVIVENERTTNGQSAYPS